MYLVGESCFISSRIIIQNHHIQRFAIFVLPNFIISCAVDVFVRRKPCALLPKRIHNEPSAVVRGCALGWWLGWELDGWGDWVAFPRRENVL